MLRRLSLIFICTLLTASSVSAQNYFNPSIGLSGSGNSFQGANFSGVGGALLSCTNVGSSISGNLSGLFNRGGQGSADGGLPRIDRYDPQTISSSSLRSAGTSIPSYQSFTTGQKVPVADDAVKKEEEKQTKTQNCLNGVAYAIAKNMLQQVTTRTLNFVNKGFAGNPLYVRDLESYMASIRNEKLGSFINTVSSTDPVFGNALRSVITQQVTGWSDGRINTVMNTPEGRAYQDFQNDFTQGGWSAFLNPRNNAIGAYFNAVDSVSSSISTAQQNTREELAQGDGFLSVKTCVQWSDAGTDMQNPDAPLASDPSKRTCLKYQTVTPGKIVAEQTAAVTTSPVRQLEQADQINEVLGSFFDQLLNRLFAGGLGGINGSNSTKCVAGSGIGCNSVFDANGQPINTSIDATALGYQPTTGGFNGDFDISRPQQLRAVIQTQANYLNAAEDAQVALSRIVPITGALDYCLPGPNPTWQEGLGNNYNTYIGSLVQPSPDNPSFFQNLVNSIPVIGGLFGGTPKPPPILASTGTILFDKVTDNSIDTNNRPVYEGYTLRQTKYTLDTTDPLFKINVDDDNVIDVIRQYISRGYNALVADYTTKFSSSTIINAFAALPGTQAEQDFARNRTTDALKEASKLVAYNRATVEYNQQYNDAISQTDYALRELKDIYAEVNVIVNGRGKRGDANYVEGAKNRYIREMRAAGTPVDVTRVVDARGRPGDRCIDQAYRINTSPIIGAVGVDKNGDWIRHNESNTSPDDREFVEPSIEAGEYFYSHLTYTP